VVPSWNASKHEYKAALRRQYGSRFQEVYQQYPLERFHGNAASVRATACQRSQAVVLGTTLHRVVSLCSHTDNSHCVQAFLQTNSDLRLFCPSKRIADLVSRSPGRNTSAFLYYFSRGPRPGDWLSNQQVRPFSLLSDADCVQCWCLATLFRGRLFLTAVQLDRSRER